MQYNTQVAVATRIRITTIIAVVSLALSVVLLLILPQAAHAKSDDKPRSSSASLSAQLKKAARHAGRSYASPFSFGQSRASPVSPHTEQVVNTLTPEPTAATATSSPDPAPVTAASTTSSPSSATVAVAARETVDIDSLRLATLITPLSLKTLPRTVTTAGTVSHASFVPLQTSEKGWELFGVAWYWWTIAAAAGGGAFIWKRRLV